MKKLLVLFYFFVQFGCNLSTITDKSLSKRKLKILESQSYQLKHYSDWTIDSNDVDFDIDSYFILNSPSGSGSISFFILNTAVDEQHWLDEQVKNHLEKLIKNGTVSNFETWGNYRGHGATITGKSLGLFKAEAKIFVHSEDSSSFLIVNQILNNDRKQDLPGLKLIESTFKLKEK